MQSTLALTRHRSFQVCVGLNMTRNIQDSQFLLIVEAPGVVKLNHFSNKMILV